MRENAVAGDVVGAEGGMKADGSMVGDEVEEAEREEG